MLKLFYIRGFVFSVLFLWFIVGCGKENSSVEKHDKKEIPNTPAKIEFYKTAKDFGTIQHGQVVEYSFRFKNTGGKPLKINFVEADCGCTTVSYYEGDVLFNQEGKIKVRFDSDGFMNNQYKRIKVITNTPDTVILELQAFVEIN